MTKKPTTSKDAADKVLKNIRRKTRQTEVVWTRWRIIRRARGPFGTAFRMSAAMI